MGFPRTKDEMTRSSADEEKVYRELQRKYQGKQNASKPQVTEKMKKLPTSWSGKLYDRVLKEATDYRTPEQVAVDKIFEDL